MIELLIGSKMTAVNIPGEPSKVNLDFLKGLKSSDYEKYMLDEGYDLNDVF
jgi:hypothetical protein